MSSVEQHRIDRINKILERLDAIPEELDESMYKYLPGI